MGSRFDLNKAGGVTTMVLGLAEGLTQLGDQVSLIKPDFSETADVQVDGHVYRRIRMRPLRAPSIRMRAAALALAPVTTYALAQLIRAAQPDVVNLHYFDEVWSYLILLKRWTRVPLILSFHGGDLRGTEGHRNRRLLNRWSDEVDAAVFCSSVLRDEVLPDCPALAQKSHVIRNGVDVAVPPVPLDSRADRIACIAHLFRWKGVDVLLEAFGRIAANHPTTFLEIAGQGPETESLRAQASRLRFPERVRFLGPVPRDRALSLIASSRLLCLPSREEGLPVVVLEGMACKTAMVSTTVGGIPELLRNGTDALLVKPDDPASLASALDRLLADRRLSDSLAESAWDRYEAEFTGKAYVASYRRLFQELIAKRTASSASA